MATICKLFNESIFAGHDLMEVEGHIVGVDSPWFRVTGEVHDFSSVKQRFGWHTAAEDAETADFLATLDDDDIESRARSSSRGGVTGAAATDDGEVVIAVVGGLCH